MARLSNNRDKIFITCNTTKREEVKALEGMGVKKTIAFIVEKKLTCFIDSPLLEIVLRKPQKAK